MSILSLPRLYFTGEIFWNPNTANNSDEHYNESSNTVATPLPEGVNYDNYKRYMMTYQEDGQLPGAWNYFGDHACNFVNYDDTDARKTQIVGGTLPDGSDVTAEDPIIGKGVQILGNTFNESTTLPPCRLVDVDPYCTWSSQIFFDSLAIGDDQIGITGPRHQRMYSYWIGQRSLADLQIAGIFSVVWQTAIPKEKLTIKNPDSSPLLKALWKGMQEDQARGLMIRFSTYRTLYYQNDIRNKYPDKAIDKPALSELYLQGKFFPNPAYSLVTGSIGIWNQDEPATAPAGRYLVANDVSIKPQNNDDSISLKPAIAHLNAQGKTLSLDFLDTFPEIDEAATKANFGSFKVQVINGDTVTDIATLDYKDYYKQAYESRAGIIDIDLNDDSLVEKIEQGRLALSVDQSVDQGVQSVRALEEKPYTAISDDRGVYIEEGETKSCLIQVQYKGKPAPAGTKLLLAQYDNNLRLMPADNAVSSFSPGFTSGGSTLNPNLFRAEKTPKSAISKKQSATVEDQITSGRVNISTGDILTVCNGGTVTLDLNSVSPGCCNIGLFPFGSGETAPLPPEELNTEYDNYITIRAMPFDNQLEDSTADEYLTWQFMYENFFQVYNLIYPVMSEVIPMDNRTLMEGALRQIRAVLGEDIEDNGEVKNSMWESTMYMSVTRDLSYGKRKLLRRWCNLVERDKQP
ncbi:MAG: hypothetical protein F6K56_28130 [Moorea sp. SIO3G5]|nr:hypothetical protein [Moorena sp. SIO3G5]